MIEGIQFDIRKLSALAKVEITDDDIQQVEEQLRTILDFFSGLDAIDTTGIEPTWCVSSANVSLRSDSPAPGISRELLFKNAPEAYSGYLIVPPVIE